MHTAAAHPEYLDRNSVPQDRLEHEKEVLKKEALNEGKPENIVEKKWLKVDLTSSYQELV